jgi:4-hydroxy-2-oxoheptanedioate aldolase
MNMMEKKMVDLLTDLKENYHVIGIKTEFEAEGARMDEICRLKEVTMKAGLGITLKIGGCEAMNDMRHARTIGVSQLVAPMIESAFALKKFVTTANTIFTKDELEDIELFANVETITGYNNFDKMLEKPESNQLGGVVIGRVDMASSMGLTFEDVNSEKLFTICNEIFSKTKSKFPKAECTLGGVIGTGALPFLHAFQPGTVDAYESRKVIFGVSDDPDEIAREGFRKAIQFEQMWYGNKRECYSRFTKEDEHYLKVLQTNYDLMD